MAKIFAFYKRYKKSTVSVTPFIVIEILENTAAIIRSAVFNNSIAANDN